MATDLRTTVVPQVEANLPFPRCIAVDFDGTLFVTDFPHIYEPKWDVINHAKAEQAAGTVLILWTCRHGEPLNEALRACAEVGLTFDYVNEAEPLRVAYFGGDARKIGADEYWDDRAVQIA